MRITTVAALLLALLALFVAACGGDHSEPKPQAADKRSMKQGSQAVNAEACIIRGGASSVKHPKPRLWIGTDPRVGVTRFDSPREAQIAVDVSTDIYAKRAGRYAVLGPLKDVEGPAGRGAVKTVADCLKNG